MTVIRQATPADVLLVAALTIQAARAAGLTPETGFMDRFAESWLAYRDQHPVWIAEHDGEHAGLLRAARSRPMPWPGARGGGSLVVELLFVRPDRRGRGVEQALAAAMLEWAGGRGLQRVLVGPEVAAFPATGFTECHGYRMHTFGA